MKVVIEQPTTPVYLTPDEALLFIEFKKRYHIIAPLIGYMETMRIPDLKEASVVMDIDSSGKVSHTAITKHYRI